MSAPPGPRSLHWRAPGKSPFPPVLVEMHEKADQTPPPGFAAVFVTAGTNGEFATTKTLAADDEVIEDDAALSDAAVAIADAAIDLHIKQPVMMDEEDDAVKAYMAAHRGAYGFAAVVVDTRLRPHGKMLELHKPTRAMPMGYAVGRSKKTLQMLARTAFPDLTDEQAAASVLDMRMMRFGNIDVVVLIPEESVTATLVYKLRLSSVQGNREQSVSLLRVNLCSGAGFDARTAPVLVESELRVLFRDMKIPDVAAPSKPKRAPASRKRKGVYSVICDAFVKKHRGASAAEQVICAATINFMAIFRGLLGDTVFEEVFTMYTTRGEATMCTLLGNPATMRAIADTSDTGSAARETLHTSIDAFESILV